MTILHYNILYCTIIYYNYLCSQSLLWGSSRNPLYFHSCFCFHMQQGIDCLKGWLMTNTITPFFLSLYPNMSTTWGPGLYCLGNWTCMMTAALSSVVRANPPSMKSDLIKIVWIQFDLRLKSLNLSLCVCVIWCMHCIVCKTILRASDSERLKTRHGEGVLYVDDQSGKETYWRSEGRAKRIHLKFSLR